MLNIKNPETHRLAHQLAGLTGETLTTAVTTSLRERLERVKVEGAVKASVEDLLKIGAECSAHLHTPWREGEEPTAFLYDENGLPA